MDTHEHTTVKWSIENSDLDVLRYANKHIPGI